jgi:hypothetical protein
MELNFKAKLSKFSLFLTILTNIGIIFVCYVMLFREDLLKNTNQPPIIFKYILVLVILIIFLIGFLLHPFKYSISNSKICIHRLIFKKSIEISSILEIKEIKYSQLYVKIRLFGSGGIWGYFGLFNSSYYGLIRMNASNLENLILITTKNKKIYVISPNNPQEFINTFNELKYNK